MVRDSAAHSGVPDSRNVFEFGYPDETMDRSTRNAGATTKLAHRDLQAGTRARSVFETGTAPFVPSPSMSMSQSRAGVSLSPDNSGQGVNGTTFQDRFFPAASPTRGGLPGLLASVAEIDPVNPFLPLPPVDKVPTRRLIGRLAE